MLNENVALDGPVRVSRVSDDDGFDVVAVTSGGVTVDLPVDVAREVGVAIHHAVRGTRI